MQNDEQRIFFSMPGETTSAEVILDILQKNGIEDIDDDIVDENKTLRFVIINNIAKNLFDKKITENEATALLQKEIGISKENAMGIVNDIKTKLIPFGKKITIPADGIQTKSPKNLNSTSSLQPAVNLEEIMNKEKIETPNNTIPKPKRIIKTQENIKTSNINKNSGVNDTYREPIE